MPSLVATVRVTLRSPVRRAALGPAEPPGLPGRGGEAGRSVGGRLASRCWQLQEGGSLGLCCHSAWAAGARAREGNTWVAAMLPCCGGRGHAAPRALRARPPFLLDPALMAGGRQVGHSLLIKWRQNGGKGLAHSEAVQNWPHLRVLLAMLSTWSVCSLLQGGTRGGVQRSTSKHIMAWAACSAACAAGGTPQGLCPP